MWTPPSPQVLTGQPRIPRGTGRKRRLKAQPSGFSHLSHFYEVGISIQTRPVLLGSSRTRERPRAARGRGCEPGTENYSTQEALLRVPMTSGHMTVQEGGASGRFPTNAICFGPEVPGCLVRALWGRGPSRAPRGYRAGEEASKLRSTLVRPEPPVRRLFPAASGPVRHFRAGRRPGGGQFGDPEGGSRGPGWRRLRCSTTRGHRKTVNGPFCGFPGESPGRWGRQPGPVIIHSCDVTGESFALSVFTGCPVPTPELIQQREHRQQPWTARLGCAQSTQPDDSRKTKATEPTTPEPALCEGAGLQGHLSHEASRASPWVRALDQGRPPDRQEGRLRALREKLPRRASAGPGGLGTEDRVRLRAVQEQVPAGDTVLGEENAFRCGECGKVFNKKHLLAGHEKIHSGVKPYECTECGKTFIKSTHLLQHQMIHTGERPYECLECGKAFNRKSYLTQHQRIHSGEKPYTCGECGKAFTHRSNFVLHSRRHSREKSFVCTECGQVFRHRGGFLRHYVVHSGENPFECFECGQVFKHRSYLLWHQQTHTGKKPYECSECGKVFLESAALIHHYVIHTGEKPFECPECGKAFNHRAYLKRHQRIHTGEKPYVCGECGKAFTHCSTFILHRRTHTGEKPFECKECGKAFSNRKDLIRHFSIHTGEKPYECTDCGKAFNRMSGLTRHKRIHSGEKPFECVECGKTFCWSTNLIRHAVIHTGEKPYVCGECGKAFSRSSSLSQHQRMHSGRNPARMSKEGRPFPSAHPSVTFQELLMGKDFMNATPEGNLAPEERASSAPEHSHQRAAL
ncbi:Zinc finger protein 264 [Heterocephalus glaber]|uniref:Zinc finger protein 264 n=1 Tax=Heterocephalus glaber TaxID=10181 RepID=G5C8H4_HETGA|nr:Zinc finger protein 264 [Heterocephalus glaber]